MSPHATLRQLLDRIGESSPADGGPAWLRGVADALAGGARASDTCAPAFVAAGRRVGRGPLAPGSALVGPDDEVTADGWSVDDAARAALLVAAAIGSPAALADLVDEVYRGGDSREKRGVVRALSLLPDGGRFTHHALDVARMNEADLFAALACDNPFPARHYADAEWNKLVMKAAFVGAPLGRMVGHQRRSNPDLARMAMDHVSEQEQAWRRFSPDIWLVAAAHLDDGALARMIGYLNHGVAETRAGAARGLGRAGRPRARPFLLDRAGIEPDLSVRAAIARALEELPS